jgi:hypothetical protein
MPKHTTISGQRIDYDEPAPATAAFLERLVAMMRDPSVSESEMIGFAHAREKPILDHRLPEGGAVTEAVLADPLYLVITDLLARKRIALEGSARGAEPSHAATAEPVDHTLVVRIGNVPGKAMRFRGPGDLQDLERIEGNIVQGRLSSGWARAAVLSGGAGDDRFWELEPGPAENTIRWGPFFVTGRFREVRRENNARRAREAWKSFGAK